MKTISLNNFNIGSDESFLIIAGPCVIESESHALKIARECAQIASEKGAAYIFKASFDKANRSSIKSFRGPGLEKGLDVLKKIRSEIGIPVLTDVHSIEQIKPAAEVVDVLQIPAFLCRQTDLLAAAAKTGKIVNVKKGQFMAPWDMGNVVAKLEESGTDKILLTERGVSFGYNNLVSDFRSLPVMRNLGYPVVYDATHSVQLPGGKGNVSDGQSQYIPMLARAAAAVGCDGLFMEVHDQPEKALSDGPNALNLKYLPGLISEVLEINSIVKKNLVTAGSP